MKTNDFSEYHVHSNCNQHVVCKHHPLMITSHGVNLSNTIRNYLLSRTTQHLGTKNTRKTKHKLRISGDLRSGTNHSRPAQTGTPSSYNNDWPFGGQQGNVFLQLVQFLFEHLFPLHFPDRIKDSIVCNLLVPFVHVGPLHFEFAQQCIPLCLCKGFSAHFANFRALRVEVIVYHTFFFLDIIFDVFQIFWHLAVVLLFGVLW